VYDRATTYFPGEFKRFNLNIENDIVPPPSGNQAIATTTGGQELAVTALLPANVSWAVAPDDSPGVYGAAPDYVFYHLWTQDSGEPNVTEPVWSSNDVRFLNVLQGMDAGQSPDPTTLVQSSAGDSYDGAIVGGFAALFKHDATTPLATTTFTLSSNATYVYVSGLTPGGGYTATVTTTPNTWTVTITTGGGTIADSGVVVALAP
jgi:hypothetical protein